MSNIPSFSCKKIFHFDLDEIVRNRNISKIQDPFHSLLIFSYLITSQSPLISNLLSLLNLPVAPSLHVHALQAGATLELIKVSKIYHHSFA